MFKEEVLLEPNEHKYYDRAGREYESVSSFLSAFKTPFPEKVISLNMAAAAVGKEKGVSSPVAKRRFPHEVKDKAAEIRKQWEQKKNKGLDHGTFIHGLCENFFIVGTSKSKVLDKALEKFKNETLWDGEKDMIYPEQVIYYQKELLAGTTDLVKGRRQAYNDDNGLILDLYDFKTNLAQGIQYSSNKINDDNIEKVYNRYMLPPVDHIEDCNYNHYTIQLNAYALMAMITYKVKIGSLNIVFVKTNDDHEFKPNLITSAEISVFPVFYNPTVIIDMLNHRRSNSIKFRKLYDNYIKLSKQGTDAVLRTDTNYEYNYDINIDDF